MGRPVFLSDNVFNPRIYPGHTLSASSTASGTDVLNLSSGRRIGGVNLGGWYASAANTDGHVTATFDALLAFDLAFIDRGHNLDGQTVRVRISDDDFTTYTEVGPRTVPSSPTPYASLYDGQIVRTDEGALLWWLGLQSGYAVRFYVDAMGAGIRPELVGLMVGKSWTPGHAVIKPEVMPQTTFLSEETRTPQAQSAGSEIGRFASARVRMRMASWSEYATARYPFEALYFSGKPMVWLWDDGAAERAVLSRVPPGRYGFQNPTDQYLPELDIPIAETEPVLL